MRTSFRSAWVRLAASAVFFVGGRALAQNGLYLPNTTETSAGALGSPQALGNATSATYLVVYSAAQLANVPPGSVITGMQLRQRNIATSGWPASALTISKFDVRMADSPRTPVTISQTFAANMTNPVLVRSGALNLAAGAYPGGANTGGTPEGWGPMIKFTTPYYYGGSALAVEFRVENASASGANQADVFSVTRGAGFTSATSSTATVGVLPTAGPGLVMRLEYAEPTAPFQTGVTRMILLDVATSISAYPSIYGLDGFPMTIQSIVLEEELRLVGRGSRFVGTMYRGGGKTWWPAAANFYTRYDIQLARATHTPQTMSSTIASNIGSDAKLVRSGRLDIPAGALSPEEVYPNPSLWTMQIPFTTPYTYTGGDLMTLVRHGGLANPVGTYVGSFSTSASRYGTQIRTRAPIGNDPDATTTESDVPYPLALFSVDSGTVVPAANINTGGSMSSSVEFAQQARTCQILLSPAELTSIPVGSQITGLTLRGKAGSALPTSDLWFDSYNISVSTANRQPGAASSVFAENEGADVVEVRNGPLSVPALSLQGNASASAYGPTLYFQRAFLYQGGGLCVTIRHSGNGAQNPLTDATPDTSRCRLLGAAGASATQASLSTPYGVVARVEYNPSVLAPAALRNHAGDTGYSVFASSQGSVLQSVYAEDQLRGMRVGSVITGMSLRRCTVYESGPALWPAADLSVNRFDVTLSTSPFPPQWMSDTFINNIGIDSVLVRSGPLTIPARALPYVPSARPNENRWFIQFTEPFVYTGGPLSVTIRNDTSFADAILEDVWSSDPKVAAGRWSFGVGADATVQNKDGYNGALALRFVFVPQRNCPGDLNNDGVVDDGDFVLFANGYDLLDCGDPGMAPGCPADLNGDRSADDADFVVFAAAYNELVCP
ncbi:MAG: hypothetical protein U0573_08910 [Phycisphaerales bacterium]|nr:hypothetical protein [Planctomycetota bacterium]